MANQADFKVKKGLQVAGGDINLGNAQNAVIQVDAVSGTDTAGKTLTISGGEGTGSGVGGSIIFQTADGGSSGSSANSLATALTIADDKSTTFAGAVNTGTDGSGVDVTFHSATSSDYMLWDASEEQLKIVGTASSVALDVDTGDFTVGAYGLTNAGAATIASMAGDWTNAGRTVADLGTITTVDINGGTIDGATIATSNITVGSSKTLDVSAGTLTLANDQISGDAVTGGTIGATTITALTTAGITASADIDIGSHDLKAETLTSDVSTGTAPLTVASTTEVANLNAAKLSGADWDAPLAIGGTTAAAGTFAALTATGLSVSDGNITNVGQISLDAIAADDQDIQIKIDGDRAAALDILEGGTVSMMKFDTTNGAENIIMGNALVTIGDGTAEDTKLIFDGNEVDFRLGIDDSANEFEIGPGAAHDTTPAIVIDGSGHVTRIGQSSAGANKYLKWDNSNSRAVWDTVSGTASSVAADDIADGDGAVEIETSTGGVDISTDAVNQALTMGNTSGATVINGLTLDVNSAGVSTLDAVTSHTITTPITAITSSTSVTLTSPVVKVTSSTSQRPVFTIEDTNADGNGPTFTLAKVGGSQEDTNVVGNFTFDGQDDGDNTQTYGSIVTSVVDASAGAEKGKMVFNVAETDGTVTQGLAITGTGTDTIVDVTIGNGLQSTTTIAGNLTVSGATTTVSSTELHVTDDIITVSKGNDTIANADGSGVEIDATGATNLYWKYVHSNTAWTSNVDIDTATTSDVYKIAGTSVLTNNTLGSGVVTSSLTTVGALASGSIASGFGTISTGNAITTTALITGGSLDIDDVVINGTTIGHTDDTDLLTVANGSLTLAGTLNQEGIALMDSYSATLTTTSATTMFTIASNAYSAAKVLASVWLNDGSDNRSVTEFLFTYQGASTPSASSNIHMTEYALVDTSGSQLATFDVVKDSGNILVQITPGSSTETFVRAQITQLVI